MTLLSRITVFLLCLGIVSFIAPSTTHAANYSAVQSGDWNNTATWGGTIPGNADNVTIPAGITVNISTSVTRQVDTVILGTLINNGTLTNNGVVYNYNILTNNATIASNSNFNIMDTGTITNSSGATFTSSNGLSMEPLSMMAH
jgi:hypothetical protein